jgi:primosomal protein N'
MYRWVFSGYKCPKCGGPMIYNHTGHECSARYCDYNDIPKVDEIQFR